MSQKGSALVDGRGPRRTVTEMRSRLFTLRHVSAEDSQLLFGWANEHGVRAASFSPKLIPLEEHNTWFKKKLRDPNCAFSVVMDGQHSPVGQVRFDQEGNDAVISVSIDAKFRGRGVGSAVISLACRRLFRETSTVSIHAYIKPENAASIAAFTDARFAKIESTSLGGKDAIHLCSRDCTK
jgi:UDP-2,4-diacetamido-2,4,6-trideoxy-beta-L-altropyranose hydrolase